MWFSGARVREKDPPCVRSSRAARVRMPRKTRTVPCTREGGVVRCLGAGMRRLGWQRYIGWQRRLPQVYRMWHAGVQDAERSRWGARGALGAWGARGARGARGAHHSEGPEVWAWRAWK